MKVYGSIDALKKGIQKKYNEKIREIEKGTDEGVKRLEAGTMKEIEIIRAEAAVQTAAEANVAKARTLNEEKLKAKMEFENERERMIVSVFEEIQKRKEKIATGKEYIGYVKSEIPKGEKLECVGGSREYKKHFRDLKLDGKIVGMLFKSKNTIYDFTIDKMIESENEKLRKVVIERLFGG